MPKGNKRVAARQASLSRRKRHKSGPGPRTDLAQEPLAPPEGAAEAHPDAELPAEAAAATVTQAAPAPPPALRAPTPSVSTPALRVPSRAAAQAAAPAVARRALPQVPYLRSDLKTIGYLSLGMLVLLVILAFIL